MHRFPSAKDAFSLEPAPLGDSFRADVARQRAELESGDVKTEHPLGQQIKSLDGKTLAAKPQINPVERLGSFHSPIELHADLADALVGWRHGDGESSDTTGPPFVAPFDPGAGHGLGHVGRHHRESRDVGIPA